MGNEPTNMTRLNFEVTDAFRRRVEELRDRLGLRTMTALLAAAVGALEASLADKPLIEKPYANSQCLVTRPGWRKTPWIRGHRLHVSDLVQDIVDTENDMAIAIDYCLPVEAVEECREYIKKNLDLIKQEENEAALLCMERDNAEKHITTRDSKVDR